MSNEVPFEIKHFNELTINEFHDLIALRIEIFVVEQDCPYQELDGKDEVGYHLICKDANSSIIGTIRILPSGVSYPEASIGRLVVEKSRRGEDLGKFIMNRGINFIVEELKENNIRISAQKYLEKFYTELGFNPTGKEYLEDGIPHLEMLLKK